MNKLSTESESGRLTLVEPDDDVESDDDEEALVMREEREKIPMESDVAESSDTESGDYGEAESDGVSAKDEMDVVIPKALDQVLSMGEAEGKPLKDEEVILVTKEEMHDGVNVKIGGGDRLAVNKLFEDPMGTAKKLIGDEKVKVVWESFPEPVKCDESGREPKGLDESSHKEKGVKRKFKITDGIARKVWRNEGRFGAGGRTTGAGGSDIPNKNM